MKSKQFLEQYKKIGDDVNFYALLLIAPSFFFSRFLLSLGFIIIVINSLLEGNFKKKAEIIKQNKEAFFILFLWLIHLIGICYTNNLSDGLFDIRTKSFLFIILAYGSRTPLNQWQKSIVLHFYLLSLSLASFIAVNKFYFHSKIVSIENLPEIALQGGNLQQSIFVVFALSIICSLLINKNIRLIQNKLIYIISGFWFIFYLFLLNALTGYFLLLVLIIYNIFLILKKSKRKILILISLSVIIVSSLLYLKFLIDDFYKSDVIIFSELPKYTINGSPYQHDTLKLDKENGHYIYLYLCSDELKKEWNKRSSIDFNGKDLKNQQLSQSLIRYLSSRNLTKDSFGVAQLSPLDIQYIEKGCANYLYTKKYSIKARFHHIFWQLDTYFKKGYADRQSISQRFVYYKIAFQLIKDHFWTGVGSGDVLDESKNYIAKTNAGLSQEYSSRVHNQFIVEFVGLGFFGFLSFLFIFFYPYILKKKWKDYLFNSFYLIMMFGFFSDNLFESQLGISFFAYFYSLLYFKE